MRGLADFGYHLALESRFGNGLAVSRFNLFTSPAPQAASIQVSSCPEVLVDFLLGSFAHPRFQLFIDFHEGALSLLDGTAGNGLRDGIAGWSRVGPTTSVYITQSIGFRAVRQLVGSLADGTVFFRVRDCSEYGGADSADVSEAIQAVPDRSESGYVGLLPLFYAVGILECESCFMSVMSRSAFLDNLVARAKQRSATPAAEVR